MLKLVCASALFAGAESVLAVRVTVGPIDQWRPSGVCLAQFQSGSNTIGSYQKLTCIDTSNLEVSDYSSTDSSCSGTPTNSATMNTALIGSMACADNPSITGYIHTYLYSASGCSASTLCNHAVAAIGICERLAGGQSINGVSVSSAMRTISGSSSTQAVYSSLDCTGASLASIGGSLNACGAGANGVCNDGTPAYERESGFSYTVPSGVASGSAALAPPLLALAALPCLVVGALA